MSATPSMILSVRGLDDELKAVKLSAGSMLEGYRFGKSPITPNNTAANMVNEEENQAFQ